MIRKPENSLEAGFKKAQYITKKHAKTFYFASKVLNKEKRIACYCIYAVCRLIDEAVDLTPVNAANKLNNIKSKINISYSSQPIKENLFLALRHITNKYSIPKEYFIELISGMEIDLDKNRYSNFNELYSYCYKVAGVIGLMLLKIIGIDNEDAQKHAIELGIAMQLTNIIRDIKEDYFRNRIYLPLDELKQYNLCENDIKDSTLNNDFIDLLKMQVKRAKSYYFHSKQGIALIKQKQFRMLVALMSEIYSLILEEIEKKGYDVFSKRIYVSNIKKIMTLLKHILRNLS